MYSKLIKFIGKEDTDRLEEKSKEIQRLKRTNNKLQKENMILRREKRNVGKGEVNYPAARPKLQSRKTMYIPSTQKIGFGKRKKKNSNDFSNFEKFEYDENKIDEIENNIFSKITESVDKIFNLPTMDARSTFSGYQMLGNQLDTSHDNSYRMTIAEKKNDRDIVEAFDQIAEVPEEEERDTRFGTV